MANSDELKKFRSMVNGESSSEYSVNNDELYRFRKMAERGEDAAYQTVHMQEARSDTAYAVNRYLQNSSDYNKAYSQWISSRPSGKYVDGADAVEKKNQERQKSLKNDMHNAMVRLYSDNSGMYDSDVENASNMVMKANSANNQTGEYISAYTKYWSGVDKDTYEAANYDPSEDQKNVDYWKEAYRRAATSFSGMDKQTGVSKEYALSRWDEAEKKIQDYTRKKERIEKETAEAAYDTVRKQNIRNYDPTKDQENVDFLKAVYDRANASVDLVDPITGQNAADAEKLWKQAQKKVAQSIFEQQQLADSERWGAVSKNADFSEYSKKQQNSELYDYINDEDFRKYYDDTHTGSILGNTNEYAQYANLNPEEINIFNYYYAKDGEEKAKAYLASLGNTLNSRIGNRQYEDIKGNRALELAFGVEAGLDQFRTGVQGVVDAVSGNDTERPISHTAYASSEIREDLADWGSDVLCNSLGQIAYDAISTTANQIPSWTIGGLAGGAAGAISLGLSAGGNVYEEAIRSGATVGQARAFAAVTAASEAGLEKILGGIQNFGGLMSNHAMQRAIQSISDVGARIAIQFGGEMLSEGVEEYLQDILEPVFRNIIFDENNQVKLFTKEALYSGMLGSLTAGMMNTVSGGIQYRNDVVTGKAIQKSGKVNDLVEQGKKYSMDSLAYLMANKVNENSTPSEIGRLYREMGAFMSEQNKADIERELVETHHLTPDTAKVLASSVENIMNGEKLSERETRLLDMNRSVASAVVGTMIDQNSTVYQRRMAMNEAFSEVEKANGNDVAFTKPDEYTKIDRENTFATDENGKLMFNTDEGLMSLRNANLNDAETAVAKLIYDTSMDIETANEVWQATETARTKNDASTAIRYAASVQNAYDMGRKNIDYRLGTEGDIFARYASDSLRSKLYAKGQTDAAASTRLDADKRKMRQITKNKKGNVFIQADYKNLSDTQKSGVSVARVLSKAFGIDFAFFSSFEEGGRRVYKNSNGDIVSAQNGIYDRYTGTIYLDLNAGDNGEGLVLYAMSHELTHFIQQWSNAKYKTLSDFLMKEYAAKGKDVNTLVKAQQEKAARNGKKYSYDAAFDEVIADSMQSMLSDTNAIEKLLKLKAKDESLANRLVSQIKRFADKVRAAYAELDPDTEEGRAVKGMTDKLDEISTLWTDALKDAAENYNAADGQKNTADEGGVKYSFAGESAKTANKNLLEQAKQRIQNGEESETVRKETGWFQGYDGKWRFEIDDSQAQFRPEGDVQLMKDDSYRRLQELTDKWADDSLTEAETEEMDWLSEQFYEKVWEEKYQSVNPKNQTSLRAGDANRINREILANALDSAAQTEREKERLQEYKGIIADVSRKEARIGEIREELRKLRSGKGSRDMETIRRLTDEMRTLEANVSVADSKLLRLQATKPLQNILNRNKAEFDRLLSEQTRQAAKNQRLADERAYGEYIAELKRHNKEVAQRKDIRKQETVLRNDIKKIISGLDKRMLHPTEGKYVPKAMKGVVAEILANIDRTSAKGDTAPNKLLAALSTQYKAMADTNKDSSYAFDSAVSEMLETVAAYNKPMRDMNVVELKNTKDALTALDHAIKNAVKVESFKILGITEDMNVFQFSKKLIQETRSLPASQRGIAYKFFLTQLRPETVFRWFGGYSKNSAWTAIYNAFDSAQKKGMFIQKDLNSCFDQVVISKEARTLFDLNNMVDVGLRSESGEPVYITRGMMLSLYMHLLNEQNAKHVMEGGITVPNMKDYYTGKLDNAYGVNQIHVFGISQGIAALREEYNRIEQMISNGDENTDIMEMESRLNDIENQIEQMQKDGNVYIDNILSEINGMLTDYERSVISATQELYLKSQKYLNEATMQMYGFEKANVENYFPIITDKAFLGTQFDSISANFNLENAGFMKERTDGANPILLSDIMDVNAKQIRRSAQYASMTPVLKDFNKVFGKTETGYRDSVQKALEQKFNVQGKQYIENLISDLNGSSIARNEISGLDHYLSKVRGNVAQGTLSMNARVAFSQAASIPTASVEIGREAVMYSIRKAFTKSDLDLIEKYSPLLWYRMQGNSTIKIEDLKRNRTLLGRIRNSKAYKYAMGWCGYVDSWAVQRLWFGAEYWVEHNTKLEKGSDAFYKAVAEKFDATVERTQPNYSTLQMSDIRRSKNPFVKTLTMFTSQRNQNMNILADAWLDLYYTRQQKLDGDRNITQEDVTAAKKKFASAVGSQVVSAGTYVLMRYLVDAIMHNMNAYRDDDDEITFGSTAQEILNQLGASIAGMSIFGSEIYDFVYKRLADKTYYSPSLSGISSISDLIKSAWNVWSKPTGTNLYKLAKDFSTVLGIPMNNAVKIVRGFSQHIQDFINHEFFSFEAGVERTTGQQKNRWLEAALDGDTEKVNRVYSELMKYRMSLGDTETEAKKQTDTNIKNAVKDALLSGEIGTDEAEGVLVKNNILSASEAKQKVEWWVFSVDYDDWYDDLFYKYAQYAEPVGITAEMFYEAHEATKSMTADKDKNGNTINGSRKKKVLDYINRLKISKTQKDALYIALGEKESTIDEAPWH